MEGTNGTNSDIVRFITCDTHHVDNWLDLWITFFDPLVTDITPDIRRVALTFQGMYDSITTYKQLNTNPSEPPNKSK